MSQAAGLRPLLTILQNAIQPACNLSATLTYSYSESNHGRAAGRSRRASLVATILARSSTCRAKTVHLLMFITNDVFEVPVPAALGRPGDHYFRTIELGVRCAWFTVTFQLADDPMRPLHTYCCSWDRQVLDLLRGDAGLVIASIQQLRPTGGRQAGWEMHNVRRIWTAWDSQQEMELLIFEDEQGCEFEGWLGEAPRGTLASALSSRI